MSDEGTRDVSTMSPAERIVSEAVGRLMEFWGFKRNMGRVWVVLHLSDEPLTSRDLRERLVLSSGSVSMTLNELQRWGVVKRVWVQGSRAEHFAAENSLWKMVSRVLRERELVEIHEAILAFEEGLRALADQTPRDDVERRRIAMQKERVEELLEVARLGRGLLEALVSTARVDATALAKLLLGSKE
ncbi:GbsR/MarR family transcriptional regulator [Sandaracinus amylolyticus]|uniref:HTH-type transcriptional regulator n=1 Tax=Sandaracinus amylolyticus TaxID=927083 RepID=A0A0F6YJ34_9BACT|nr:MarR family transcriptional regulator [Sandaracinus amylolyticus]AKF06903.1 Putative transcriptional regulator arsR family [Sandaracinus amylolyticus]